jgi:hypothetical protein
MNRFTIASAILGFFSVVAGASWMYRPLGPIAGGMLLIVAAFMSARKR